MQLNSLIKELRFDKRITEWSIRYNVMTYEDYHKYLQSLPDLSDQKENITGEQIEREENPEEQ